MTEQTCKQLCEDEAANVINTEGPRNEETLIEQCCNKFDWEECSIGRFDADKTRENKKEFADDDQSVVQEVDVECRVAGEDLTLHILSIIRTQVTLFVQ